MENDRTSIHFGGIALSDADHAYGAAYDFNAVFFIDLPTGKCRYIDSIPGERIRSEYLYSTAQYHMGKAVFFPRRAAKIAILDISTNRFELVDIPGIEKTEFNKKNQFSNSFKYEEKIYGVGCTLPVIAEYDSCKEKTDFYYYEAGKDIYFSEVGVIVKDRYYVPSVTSPVILEFNAAKKNIILHDIENENYEGTYCLAFDGTYLWTCPKNSNNPILRIDIKNWQTKEVRCHFEEKDYADRMFFLNGYDNGLVYMYPGTDESVYSIDTVNGKLKKLDYNLSFYDGSIRGYFSKANNTWFTKLIPQGKAWNHTGFETEELIDLKTGEKKPYQFDFFENYDRYLEKMILEEKNDKYGKILKTKHLCELEDFRLVDYCKAIGSGMLEK